MIQLRSNEVTHSQDTPVQGRMKEGTDSKEQRIERQMAFEQSHAYFVEAQARPIRLASIEVVDKTPQAQSTFFGLPGTLTVFVARKGTDALTQIRQALTTGGEELKRLYQKFGEQAAQV